MRFLDFCTRIHALKTSTNVMIMLNDDLILSMSAPCMQAMLVATQALIHIINTSSYDVSAFATRPMTWPGIGLTWLESGPLFWVWLASSGTGRKPCPSILFSHWFWPLVDFDFCIDLWLGVNFQEGISCLIVHINSFWILFLHLKLQNRLTSIFIIMVHSKLSSRYLQEIFLYLSNFKLSSSFHLEFEGKC